jgi:hypothetical protein
MPATLKQRCLDLLRQKRLDDGNCYHGYRKLADELGCPADELFNWNEDSGVLQELHDDGDVHLIGGRDAAVVAELDGPWN